MSDVNQKIREITKSRIIAALMAELDAAKAIVFATDAVTGQVHHGTIECLFRIPFAESTIELSNNNLEAKLLSCACCFTGQRIEFTLRKNANGSWEIPEKVLIIELRSEHRTEFSKRLYSAELIDNRMATYGYAIDVNRDFIALEIDGHAELLIGNPAKVIVRLISTNFDVFFSSCLVADVTKGAGDTQRVLLRIIQSPKQSIGQRVYKRSLVDGVAIELSGDLFSGDGFKLWGAVTNYSTGGLTVKMKPQGVPFQAVPGMIVYAKDPMLSFMIVWATSDELGIRPVLADQTRLRAWLSYGDRLAPSPNKRSSVTRRELAELFTHSGLLKGQRRLPFGKDVHEHMITNPDFDSALLTQRCVISSADGNVELHVSSKRIAEQSWFFGEGTALTEKVGEYNLMLEACTKRMLWMARQSSLVCRFLTSIWHYTVKSAASWGENLAENKASILLDSFQCSIKELEVSITQDMHQNQKFLSLSGVSAQQRREVSLCFHPQLYEAFVGGDGSHPILNSELAKLGPYHRVETKMVSLQDSKFLIAHRVFTHNVWSSTGVTNSVFVLVPIGTKPQHLQEALKAIAQDEISFGTDDFLIIFDGPLGACIPYEAVLPKPKRFSFLIHDLISSDTQVYVDSVEEIADRNKK